MKFLKQRFQKYLLYKNKWLEPYIRVLLGVMTVVTDMAALVFIATLVYEHGFFLSKIEGRQLATIYDWVWVAFFLEITLRLIFGYWLKQERYKLLTRILSALFYLTLLPVLIPQPSVMFFGWIWEFFHSVYYRDTLLLIFSLFYLSNSLIRLLGRRTNPSLILATSFLVIILVGTGLLMLPRCTVNGISWVDSLYIATSSVCVTGLTPVDVASTFTPMGFTVIIILIQIGGLGVMTLTSFFAMFFMGNTSLYNQLVVRDMVSSKSLGSLLSTLLHILGFTLVLEGIGMLAIWWSIHGALRMTLDEEVAFSAFHAISAFCNAGFSTMPGNLGNPLLMNGYNSFYILISFLIILGGLGFPILVNLKDVIAHRVRSAWKYLHTHERIPWRMYHQFDLNSHIVLGPTLLLLIGGTLVIGFFEWDHAFAGMPVGDKWTQAFFNAVSPRTAGFTSVDLTTLGVQSILFYMFLMWVGGGAQSTAGGIKVNAFVVIVLNMIAILRGSNRVEAFGRELSADSIRRANATMVMSLGAIFLFTFMLTMSEPELPVITIVFECISAIGTVGSSLNASPLFSDTGKILIVLLMFVGRVGLITFMLGLVKQKRNQKYRYPSNDVIIN